MRAIIRIHKDYGVNGIRYSWEIYPGKAIFITKYGYDYRTPKEAIKAAHRAAKWMDITITKEDNPYELSGN